MSYTVFIGDLQLPFNPETIADSIQHSIKEYSVIGKGKVPVLEDAGLRHWNFDFVLFSTNDLASENYKSPSEVLTYLENNLKSGTYLRLIISNGTSYGQSSLVYLEELDKKEVLDGDYEVSVKLTEYVEAKARETGIPSIQRPGIIPPKKPIKVNGSAYNSKKKADDLFGLGSGVVSKGIEDINPDKRNEVTDGNYISVSNPEYTAPNYHYDDSAIREYVEKREQPIQYTYPTQKSQADKNLNAINSGLDVFIG